MNRDQIIKSSMEKAVAQIQIRLHPHMHTDTKWTSDTTQTAQKQVLQ